MQTQRATGTNFRTIHVRYIYSVILLQLKILSLPFSFKLINYVFHQSSFDQTTFDQQKANSNPRFKQIKHVAGLGGAVRQATDQSHCHSSYTQYLYVYYTAD